jgi:hypothetical protein
MSPQRYFVRTAAVIAFLGSLPFAFGRSADLGSLVFLALAVCTATAVAVCISTFLVQDGKLTSAATWGWAGIATSAIFAFMFWVVADLANRMYTGNWHPVIDPPWQHAGILLVSFIVSAPFGLAGAAFVRHRIKLQQRAPEQ